MTQDEARYEQDVVLLDYLLPLLKWRWLIFLGTALSAALGIAIAMFQTPVYTATAYFVPRGSMGEPIELSGLVGESGKDWETIRSSTEIVQYYSVVLTAQSLVTGVLGQEFETTRFGQVPLIETLRPTESEGKSEAQRMAAAILRFRKLLAVESGGGKIVKLSYTSEEPELSAHVVGAVIKQYAALMKNKGRTADALTFINDRRTSVSKELEAAEREISLARSKRMDIGDPIVEMRLSRMQREADSLMDQLTTLNSELAMAQVRELQRKEMSMEEIDVIEPASPPLLKSNMSRSRIVLLCAMLGSMLTSSFAIGIGFLTKLRLSNAEHDFWTRLAQFKRDLLIMGAAAVAVVGAAAAYYFGLIG